MTAFPPASRRPSRAAQIVVAAVGAVLIWMIVGGLWFVATPACNDAPSGWVVGLTKLAAAVIGVGYVLGVRSAVRAQPDPDRPGWVPVALAVAAMLPAWSYVALFWPDDSSGMFCF